jgi:hypothetical protein
LTPIAKVKKYFTYTVSFTTSKSKMITRRPEGGDELYFIYVKEACDDPGIRRASLPTKIAL